MYLVRLADGGGAWATYFSGGSPAGQLLDRNGGGALPSDGETYSFAADETVAPRGLSPDGGHARERCHRGSQAVPRPADGLQLCERHLQRGKTLQLTVGFRPERRGVQRPRGPERGRAADGLHYGRDTLHGLHPGGRPGEPLRFPGGGTYINKTIGASFVPGSVYKLVTLAAAIDNIPDLFERSFYCAGSSDLDGIKLNCTGTHGSQTIEQALANSCNCAFGEIALELGYDTLVEYAEKLGFTASLTLDGMDVTRGSIDWEQEDARIGLAWTGIGQHNDLVCPYAMVRYVAAIANGGSVYEPTLLGHGELDRETSLLSADTARQIASMMDYNVETAYGGEWTFPGLDVAAKTGTAEVGDGTSHAWMTGFLNDPEHPYAFVVLVEHAGGGLTNAGRLRMPCCRPPSGDCRGETFCHPISLVLPKETGVAPQRKTPSCAWTHSAPLCGAKAALQSGHPVV